MKKLNGSDEEARSADIVGDNLAKLKKLFPELLTETAEGAVVNVDVLKQLVGDKTITESDEKYGLNWHGKRRARQVALTPSAGTLRPCPEGSVDWDKTKNLMIEGDNLEVLKLLQKSYAGKVKLIYIDPPYNTGKDFVYPDNFQDSIKNYLELTGQTGDGGAKFTTNVESSGRFHTDWLNMMYPRLKLARNLLRDDGVIFVSIDDAEVAHLRLVMDDIFGPENFIAEIICEGANKNDARQVGIVHEYAVVYARERSAVPREWALSKEGVEPVLEEVNRLKEIHGANFEAASDELAGWFRSMKATPSFGLRRFRYIDARGAYKEDDPTAPGGRRFGLINPSTGKVIPLRSNRGWAFDQAEFNRLVSEGRISFITQSSVMVRRYLHETSMATPSSVIYQPARSASERLGALMGAEVFNFPKDEHVIGKFIEMSSSKGQDEVVVDFFAGSGTTAHSVWLQNAIDGVNRRFVMVQIPEKLEQDNDSQKAAADFCDKIKAPRNIASLSKERLRRAGIQVKSDHPLFAGDLGFRVFKLDSTNIREWDPDKGKIAESLEAHVEHIKADRSEQDILFELLLKLGLDLCVPIETKKIQGKEVHSIGAGALIACLAPEIKSDQVELLAQGIVVWHKAQNTAGDSMIVFRDSAFADDIAKTNLTSILNQNGLHNVRSL